MKKILILNTGGTFNKIYNPLTGNLDVNDNDTAIQKITQSFYNLEITIKSIINKDSLDFTKKDREYLLDIVKNTTCNNVIIIHGTDTIDKSAKTIKKAAIEKKVIFVGSMIPFSIDTIEATANLSLAVGFLSSKAKNGVYIAMHGVVAHSEKLIKNRLKGQFLLS